MSFKGLDILGDVLDIIKDPAKYEAKLKELRAATAKHQEVIEATVKLADVDKFVSDIDRRLKYSEETLSKAQEEAKRLVDGAKAEARVVAEAAAKQVAKAKELESIADAKMANALAKEEDLVAREKAVAQMDAENRRYQNALNDLKNELNDRRAKLMAALG